MRVCTKTAAQSIAECVTRLVGRADIIDEPWFASGVERAHHAEELDEAVGG
jgi:crotonobetainyl-CoA:carnitine CoA-transferase CaiB-like acyl-CoA transferase